MRTIPLYSNINSKISFAKTFINRTYVRKNDGTSMPVNFVEYDSKNKDDREQISNLQDKWSHAFYIQNVTKDFLNKKTGFGRPVQRLKGIEDGKGNVFAIAELQTKSKVKAGKFGRYEYIAYILADPDKKYETYTTTRSYKGLGETLVKEIVKQAKKEGKSCVELCSANEGFWKKSGLFNRVPSKDGCLLRRLENEDFDKYIEYVERKQRPAVSRIDISA